MDAMCIANGLTDAFALEARPSSATYNPVSAAAWNAAARAEKANKKKEAGAGSSDEDSSSEMNKAARFEEEAKVLGAPAMTIEPGKSFQCNFGSLDFGSITTRVYYRCFSGCILDYSCRYLLNDFQDRLEINVSRATRYNCHAPTPLA